MTHITISQDVDDQGTGARDDVIGGLHATEDPGDVAQRRHLVSQRRLVGKQTHTRLRHRLQDLSLDRGGGDKPVTEQTERRINKTVCFGYSKLLRKRRLYCNDPLKDRKWTAIDIFVGQNSEVANCKAIHKPLYLYEKIYGGTTCKSQSCYPHFFLTQFTREERRNMSYIRIRGLS